MLWERLFLLVHTELGLSLLLCTSDTQSWAVTGTSRDVDLCQKHKHTNLRRVSRCITCTDAPAHAINNIKERKGVGCVCGNNLERHPDTHMDAHMYKLTLHEQKHHSKPILVVIQNNSTNRENGPHSCIYCTENERFGYNTNYHM